MPYFLIPVPVIVVLIVFYKIYRDRNDLKKIGVIQPLITCLSMAVCVLSYLTPGFNIAYTLLVLLGLALSVAADFVLVDVKDMKKLTRALVLFLLIYISYSTAVSAVQGFSSVDLYGFLALLPVAALSMAYLWSDLKKLKLPVLVYVLLLCFFISRGVATFFLPLFGTVQSVLITGAASMFFIGDLELAVSSFKKPIPLYIGPVTYAASQLFMALSACFFPS